jgi:protein-tyrosine phosphatase
MFSNHNNNYNQILPNLYIGNYHAATYTSNFDVIVNCTRDIPFSNSSKIQYIRLAINDDPSETNTLLEKAPGVLEKIRDALENRKRVLVHCYAGMQRSCALVAMYMMKYYQVISPRATMKFIKENRPVAFDPIPTFVDALHTFYSNIMIQRIG